MVGFPLLAYRCIGVLYLLSGLWCIVNPELAAGFLHYEFSSSLGLAEFFAVYGGLQLGIAAAVLVSSFIPAYRLASCLFAAIVSLGLLFCRSIAFFFIDDSNEIIGMMILEAVIAVLLLVSWRISAKRSADADLN